MRWQRPAFQKQMPSNSFCCIVSFSKTELQSQCSSSMQQNKMKDHRYRMTQWLVFLIVLSLQVSLSWTFFVNPHSRLLQAPRCPKIITSSSALRFSIFSTEFQGKSPGDNKNETNTQDSFLNLETDIRTSSDTSTGNQQRPQIALGSKESTETTPDSFTLSKSSPATSKESEQDLSGWVEGLKQWPLYPPPKTASDESSNLMKQQATGDASATTDSTSSDQDLSVWVEGLKQWPLYPPTRTTDASDSALSASTGASSSPPNEDQDDLSTWVEGLKQWPTYPMGGSSTVPDISRGDTGGRLSRENLSDFNAQRDLAAKSSTRYRGSNPLSNLMNLVDVVSPTGLDLDNPNRTIFAVAEQLFQVISDSVVEFDSSTNVQGSKPPSTMEGVRTIDELIEREKILQQSTTSTSIVPTEQDTIISDGRTISPSADPSVQQSLGEAAETMLRDATSNIEYLVNEASTALSPANLQDLIGRTSELLFSTKEASDELIQAAESIAEEQGVDIPLAQDEVRATTQYAASLVSVANSLYSAGYAYGARSGVSGSEESFLEGLLQFQQQDTSQARPLFSEFSSARRIEPFQYDVVVQKGAEMSAVAGSIYEDTLERCHYLGHSLVANGTTADVAWMVTDSIDTMDKYIEPSSTETANPDTIHVRTVTIRGFDASDDTVDRERLLNTICSPGLLPIEGGDGSVLFHGGLLRTAREIFEDIRKYIDWTSPKQKLVFNGHSVGGSLSVLLLLLMVSEYGVDFVKERVLRVYTHGSPPIAAIPKNSSWQQRDLYDCEVLSSFGLPSDIVFGFVQPYDPIVRFMSEYDPLYPLVDDLGPDETTVYATGPRRSLRPITRIIFSSWEGWPEFRENWKSTNSKLQNLQCVGIQHLLVPQPNRYLSDRFISPNVGVPTPEAIVRISASDMLPSLNVTFPLDVFQISLIPNAVRSFVHHFYPAYDSSIGEYATRISKAKAKLNKV